MKIDLSDGWRALDAEQRRERIRRALAGWNWLDLVQVSLRFGGWPEQRKAEVEVDDDPAQPTIRATVEVEFHEVVAGGCPAGASKLPGSGSIFVEIDRATGVGEASLEDAAIDAWGDDQYFGD